MEENMNQASNGADFQSSQRSGAQGQQRLVQGGRQIQSDVQQLYSHVRATSEDFETYLTEQVHQRPYTVLGTAAAVGYLLGGGLSSKLTLMAFGVVTRFAMALAAREMATRAATGGADAESVVSTGGGPGEGRQWH